MRTLLSAFAVGLAVAGARAQPADRVITVTGTATVYAKPDMARIHYGVRVSEPSADAVKDTLTKSTTAIDEAVKKLKLPGLAVTTAPVVIKQSSGNNGVGLAVPAAPGGAAPGPGLGPFLGFSLHTATLTEKDPEKLRAAVDGFVKAATEAGANTGGGEERESNIGVVFPGQESNGGPHVVLSREDDSAARDQALQKAVEKAVRSARAIAKGLGGGEVKVLSVADAPEPEKAGPESLLSIYGIESHAAGVRVPAGEVEVKARVVVKCSY
jgi:uncharacterized protein YggE